MSAATVLGTVQDVRGSTVSVALSDNNVSGLSFVDGHGYRIGQVGSFVRIPLGYVSLFGVVSQVGASAVPERQTLELPHGNRWMTIQLVGEGGRGHFRRGISQYPTIGDEVHLVTDGDMRSIYGRRDSSEYLQLGWVASAESIPALIDVNRLVNRHSAIVGATGSGKSTTVATLLRKLSDPIRYPAARVVLIDIHGEYGAALRDRGSVFGTSQEAEGDTALAIPYWALTFDELVPLTFGNLDEPARTVVVDRITDMKREALALQPRPGVTAETVTVDSPVPFSIRRLWFELHQREHATYIQNQAVPRQNWEPAFEVISGVKQSGDADSVAPPRYRSLKDVKEDPEKIRQGDGGINIRRQLAGLAAKLRDPRLRFLFSPGSLSPTLDGATQEDLSALLRSWLGKPGSPITILDLSGVPVSIVNQIVGSLLRLVYDAIFWSRRISEGGRERPLLVVLEEAHAYLNSNIAPAAAEAVRRIVKEGRKYGIGAMIVSQRPAEIDATILSQCGTFMALRLGNEADRRHVSTAASDSLEGLFAMLPILRVGEAIVVGEAVNLPMRLLVDAPPEEHMPDSRDPKPVVAEALDGGYRSPGGWNQARSPERYEEMVKQWRRQSGVPLDEGGL